MVRWEKIEAVQRMQDYIENNIHKPITLRGSSWSRKVIAAILKRDRYGRSASKTSQGKSRTQPDVTI
jgi:hypothetical protein